MKPDRTTLCKICRLMPERCLQWALFMLAVLLAWLAESLRGKG